ncbi:MAG TPA: sigma 54-interacting transcriptional regulator [Vicinamibacterales bacterium]|jgi:PAS domain S-box-containing protein|nr:sigma 54-interacting transcriptional regulator [Vicinamibacterales bacterium]
MAERARPLSETGPRWPVTDDQGLFRLAAESLPSGIVVVAPDGTIVLVSHQLELQFGYFREELIGQSVDILVPEESRAGTGEPQSARGRNLHGRRKDGSVFPAEIGRTRLETDEGVFVLWSVVDLSARLDVENASRQGIERELEFERLIAELSYKFINLPPDEVVEAIRDALRRIGEALEIERCSFFRVQPDGELLAPISWARAGIAQPPVVTAAREHFPWAVDNIQSGRMFCFSTTAEVPSDVDRAGYEGYGIRSSVTVPIRVAGRVVGALGFNMVERERVWSPETLHRLTVLATIFGNVLARLEGDTELRQAISDVECLRERLDAENRYLRREVQERLGTGAIIGQSAAVRRVLEQIRQVASTDSTVLLLGETGTGKELFATQIHELSGRRDRAMVRVNCAAIPATLMESELFGREKGAYTGALARQIGRFELANHSTIFLDEIGDLPPDVQVKLLRVLEERQIERLGSPRSINVDVRIIAATHRDLDKRILDEAFREDLYYRLNVFPIRVPPLRERVEDIPLLVWRFVEEFSKSFGKRIDAIPNENMAALQRYAWPGNIRELRNVVERAMIVAIGTRLTIPLTASETRPATKPRTTTLADLEKAHIRLVLENTGWRIRGAGGAAEQLGLKPTTLETRMAKLGLARLRPN